MPNESHNAALKAVKHLSHKFGYEEGPVYCEDGCSSDCDDHEMPNCIGIDVLHARLKRALLDI